MVLRVFTFFCLIAFFTTVSKSSTIKKTQNQEGFVFPDEFENRYGNKNDENKSDLKSTTISPSTVTVDSRFLVNIPSNIPTCEAGYIYVEAVGGCRKKSKHILL